MSRFRSNALAWTLAAACALAPAAARAQVLYWVDTNYATPTLNRSNLDGLGVTSVALAPGTLPEGVTAATSGRVYWTEASWANADVYRSTQDLTHRASVVGGGSSLRGIAIDETAQTLYWTSSNLAAGSRVHRSSAAGGEPVTLIALAAGANPRGIAVDRAANRIFWADFDLDAIYSAALDGSAPGVWLALGPGTAPYGVAVDPATHRVYWTEYATGNLRRADAGAVNVALVLSGLAHPTYLALDAAAGRLYWTEGGAGSQRLRRAGTNGAGLITLPPPLSTYGGVAIGSGGIVRVDEPLLPTRFAIDRVWPTPGSGPLHVEFSLPRDARVTLSVHDLQGRRTATLADGVVPAGRHERVWDRTARGAEVPVGIYFIRLASESGSWMRRVVLTR